MSDEETSQAQWYQQSLEEAEQILKSDPDYLLWLDKLNKQSMNGIENTTTQKPLNPINR